MESLAIFVDTNSGKVGDRLDFTVFLLAGVGDDGNLYIVDISRGKWDPLDLLDEAERLWDKWGAMIPITQRIGVRSMSIEDKQAGQGLITTLVKRKNMPINPIQRGANQNKFVRHSNCQPQIKMGKVFIPRIHNDDGDKIANSTWFDGTYCADTDWVVPFISECDLLTVGVLMDQEKGYDDQYDTLMDSIDEMLVLSSGSSAMDLMFM